MRDNQSLVVTIVILGIILVIGIFCYTQLEIVPSTRWEGPSKEIKANQYYALDKWLQESGYPIRILTIGNLDTVLKGPEKTVFMEISRFKWNEDSNILIPWLKDGGRLIISVDNYVNYQLEQFMDSLGLKTASYYEDDEDGTSFITETQNGEENDSDEKPPGTNIDFDWGISFKKTEADPPAEYRTLVINQNGKTKLVKYEIGKGALIFIGKALFLENYSMRQKENASLAAELFFETTPDNNVPGGKGILFIRNLNGEKFLFGNLTERGNPAALFISLILLIITGFWMVIPAFGRFKPAPEKPGKPLHDRFLAEGRFLKKNNALGKYIETYEKELEQRGRSKGIMSVLPAEPEETETANGIKTITFAQFIKEQKILTEQLEKLHKEIL